MHSSIPTTYIGIEANFVDEYYRLGESTTMECVKCFAKTMVTIFWLVYLRKPTQLVRK
jgi:hypothetical protein